MLLNLKAFSSLLLALGLFACNGDNDDKATGDYKLVVSKPSSAAVGTAMSIDVALHKGDAIVKDDDAKAAKDGKVNGSVKCKEGDKVEASEVKFNDAGKATLEITIADNSDKTAAAAGTKGYTDCVVSASAEFGKDKTKASGSSEQFAVAAKTDDDSGSVGAKTPKFNVASPKFGQEFVITDGVGKAIALGGNDGTGSCGTASLYRVSGETTKAVEELTSSHHIEEHDAFFVIGSGNCKVKVADIDDPLGFTTIGDDDGVVIAVDLTGDNIKVTFTALQDATKRANPLLFVNSGTGGWKSVNVTGWEGTTDEFPLASDTAGTVAKDSTTDSNNEALMRASGFWRHAEG